MMEREWRTVPFATNYEVSNRGEVRKTATNHYLSQSKTHKGYCQVNIKSDSGKRKSCYVHRLVAQAFVPNPQNKPSVNHKDFDPSNNNIENLEWVTIAENNLWSVDNVKKARAGIERTKETRRKISEKHIARHARPYPPYIYKKEYGYEFRIARKGKRVYSKGCKTLEETIEYKEKWINENKEVFNFA